MTPPALPLPLPHAVVRPTVVRGRASVRHDGVLPALTGEAARHDLVDLTDRLSALQAWLDDELHDVETDLRSIDGAGGARAAARHLLHAGGKRLRPVCTLLAARLGPDAVAGRPRALLLAAAGELVHAATLLHDDVVDLGETRRGQPTARLLYGNPVAIYAGDWTLVEALRRICAAGVPDMVPVALSTIEEMIFAEVEQIERARDLAADRQGYLRVIDGKTAALFRWALRAGARAGGADAETESALVAYGTHLGLAFQLTDDLLDVDGDPALTGKAQFADLAEGRVTLPLILLLERRPEMRAVLVALHAAGSRPDWRQQPDVQRLCSTVQRALRDSGTIADARQMAADLAREAGTALASLRHLHPEAAALAVIADVLADRKA